MVKINHALKMELESTIRINIKRFISLIIIILLGVGFYVGMKSNAPVLEDTMINFFNKTNYMDIQVVSVVGLSQKELNEIKKSVPEIDTIEGGYEEDLVVSLTDADDGKYKEKAVAVHSYNPDKELNRLNILRGREPKNSNEMLADATLGARGYDIGDTVTLNSDTFKEKEVTIVGFVRSPLYISTEKGNTNLLSGKINYYFYVYEGNFNYDKDLYTRGYVKLENKYKAFTEDYNDYVNNVKNKIKKLTKKIAGERVDQIIEEKSIELAKAEELYNANKAQADIELANAKAQLDDAQSQIDAAESQIMTDKEVDLYLSNIKSQLDMARSQLDSSKSTLDMAKQLVGQLSNNTSAISKEDLANLKKKLTNSYSSLNEYNDKLSSLNKELKDNINKCEDIENDTLKRTCNATSSSIQSRIDGLNGTISTLKIQIEQLTNLIGYFQNFSSVDTSSVTSYLKSLESQYYSGLSEYNAGLKNYNYAVNNMKPKMTEARKTLADKKVELENAKQTYETSKEETYKKLGSAFQELEDAKMTLKSIKNAEWYTFTRNDSAGYSQYYDDVQRIDNLSKILPLVFFLVAALVTASSTTRMVKEERSKIGVLKSLGYDNKQVLYKYLCYTGVAFIIGSIFGVMIGSLLFPKIFASVYSLLYFIPKLKYSLYIFHVFIAVGCAFISTVLVTYFIAKESLKEKPYYLMRPEVEKTKKKSFLERNEKLWKRLPFMKKISYRNIIRNIKRTLMTILGIAGCTALIVASFGTRDSVTDIIYLQYGKLFDINAELFYKDGLTNEDVEEEHQRVNNLDEVTKTALGRIEIVKTTEKNKTLEVYTIISDNLTDFYKMVNFNNVHGKSKLKLTDDGVIITEKLAKLMNIKTGDDLEFTDSYNITHKVKVSGVTENYVYHYIYMTQSMYEEIYGIPISNNLLLAKYKDNTDMTTVNKLININEKFSSMQSLSDAKASYAEMMNKFNIILIVIIVSAGLLAFVVLYNLAKINISERIREIATLKVLGFRSKEVNSYINREMTILTIIGILFGMLLGYFLTEIVITTCELDTVMFYHGISYVSYVYAFVLTFVFSKLITVMVGKDLKNINMTESLKSNE